MTTTKKTDLRIQYATIAIAALTLIISSLEFKITLNENKKLQTENIYLTHRLDSVKVVDERQTLCFADICRSVGQLSAHTQIDSVFRRSAERFRTLYYGEARLYLPVEAVDKMERFNYALTEYSEGNNNSAPQLKTSGITLVAAIRQLKFPGYKTTK